MRSRKNSPTSSQTASRALTGAAQSWLAKVIGVGLLLFGVSSFFIQFFQVSQIDCLLDEKPCPPELISYTDYFKGQPMFGTDYSQILTEHSYPLPILLQDVQKQLPNKLELHFTTQPLSYLLTSGERRLVISTTGKISEDPNLTAPVSIAVQPGLDQILETEHQVKASIHSCLNTFAEALTDSLLRQAKVSWVDKDTITLIMNGEQQTVFLDCEDPRTAINKLIFILAAPEFQEKKATIKEIDVRFDLPVLRMQQ